MNVQPVTNIKSWEDRAFKLLMDIKEERRKVKEIAYQQDLIEKEIERFRLTGEPCENKRKRRT